MRYLPGFYLQEQCQRGKRIIDLDIIADEHIRSVIKKNISVWRALKRIKHLRVLSDFACYAGERAKKNDDNFFRGYPVF